jgi:DNA replication protein DnaC
MKDQVRQHIPGCEVEISAAIVDRITFNAHVIETGTDSYRLRTSKSSARGNR